jgi:hypothetical protein
MKADKKLLSILREGLGLCLLALSLSLFFSPSSFAQPPRVDTLFNLATGTDFGNDGDSIEYRSVGRNTTNGTVENQIFFSDLNCKNLVLAWGKSMLDGTGGIFPESSGEIDNPVILDSTALASNGKLLFKMYDEIGSDWNFNLKFTNWNSYYLVFVLDYVGTCTEGVIWRVK